MRQMRTCNDVTGDPFCISFNKPIMCAIEINALVDIWKDSEKIAKFMAT